MALRAEDKLTLIRTYMEEKGLDALIVPTADPHLSEYLDKHYASREWLTGFTGSTGDVIVAKKKQLFLLIQDIGFRQKDNSQIREFLLSKHKGG